MGDCQEQVKEYLKAFKPHRLSAQTNGRVASALHICTAALVNVSAGYEMFSEWMSDTV